MSPGKFFISNEFPSNTDKLSSGLENKTSSKAYLKRELIEDLSVFSEEEKDLIEKEIAGIFLNPEEKKKRDMAVFRWWKEKYGFSFTQKLARDEVLMRKYGEFSENKKRKGLQIRFLQALGNGSDDEIQELKKEYTETFPNQLEGVEVMFGVVDFIKLEKDFRDNGNTWDLEKRKKAFQSFTEYQFLFTHFILLNSEDREFMELFWKVCFSLSEKIGGVRDFNILRRCQVSQVAVYKIIKHIGKNPKLSHPDEDAFSAIDLWSNDSAVQIKGWKEDVPAIIESEEIMFPAMEIDQDKKTHLFNSAEYLQSKNFEFKSKVKKYGEKIGRDVSGYMLVVPYSKIDFVTGEPDKEIIDFFRTELSK